MIIVGDSLLELKNLPGESVNCIVTSPPYFGLRDYGVDGQIGLETTPAEYISKMVAVFEECRRVLRKDGTCWVNMGDSYSASGAAGNREGKQASNRGSWDKPNRRAGLLGFKQKELLGMPWRLAFALQDAGWYLRSDIIWAKPNPMPESVRDRPTKAHEYIFLLTKSPKYWYDADATRTDLVESSVVRLSQNVGDQVGSERVPGKTNGTMKAVATPDSYKGSVPGRQDGPGQDRRSKNERSGQRSKVNLNANWDSAENAGTLKGANARTVWNIATKPYKEAHFATFPEELPRRCILAGCPEGGTVLDPFAGSGTTLAVAIALGRKAIGIELNESYAELARKRIASVTPGFDFSAVD